MIERTFAIFGTQMQRDGVGRDVRPISVGNCSGIDFATSKPDSEIRAYGQQFIEKRLQEYDFHPDAWGPIIIRDPQSAKERIAEVASDRYSYRQLDDYTDLLQRTLQRVPEVAKVQRAGVLPEQISLEYSDDRLAAFKLQPTKIKDILNARNVTAPGGIVQTQSRNVLIDSTAEFKSTKEIGNVLVGASPTGVPVYLRDLVDTSRDYQSPRRYLNYMDTRDAKGNWHRNRAITLAVQMRSGEQIFKFGEAVDKALATVRPQLPADLIVSRTSDQPKQVHELVSLLMGSLYEAIALVVIVALIGFWDWRAAMLMAASIPLTLAMSFGIIHVLNIDIQQVSIATLDHRARLAGGHACSCGRRDQARTGLRFPARSSILAWADQTGQGDRIRDHHQHRRVLAVSAVDRRHVLLPVQSSGRDDVHVGRFGHRVLHVHAR